MRRLRRHGLAAVLACIVAGGVAQAENLAVGVGPSGHFFLLNGSPQLRPGIGGHVFLDYRWAPQVATQFSFFATTQNGNGTDAGDNDILLFGLPTIDFKYYPLSSPGRIDPYGLLGIGLFLTSEGSAPNGTLAFGVGANAGLGVDVPLGDRLSTGLSVVFRSIGMITSLSGNNNGTGLFPITLGGNLAYHF